MDPAKSVINWKAFIKEISGGILANIFWRPSFDIPSKIPRHLVKFAHTVLSAPFFTLQKTVFGNGAEK